MKLPINNTAKRYINKKCHGPLDAHLLLINVNAILLNTPVEDKLYVRIMLKIRKAMVLLPRLELITFEIPIPGTIESANNTITLVQSIATNNQRIIAPIKIPRI